MPITTQLSSSYPPLILPMRQRENTALSENPDSTSSHSSNLAPEFQYRLWLEGCNRLDSRGNLKPLYQTAPLLPLSEARENIAQFMTLKRTMGSGAPGETWSVGILLTKLQEYCDRWLKGTKAEVRSGSLAILGKEYCKNCLEKGLGVTGIESQTTPSAWKFSTDARCYEVYYIIPPQQENALRRILDLCLYFIDHQMRMDSSQPLEFQLKEFGKFMEVLDNPEAPKEAWFTEMELRMQALRNKTERAWERKNHTIASITIPLDTQSNLKIIFSYEHLPLPSFQLNRFRLLLKGGADNLVSEIKCDTPYPLQALNDQLIQRLVLDPSAFNTSQALGEFWVYLTFYGCSLYDSFLENVLGKSVETSEAFSKGAFLLPPGEDSLIAYYFHMLQYLRNSNPHAPFPPLDLGGSPQSPMGLFLNRHLVDSPKAFDGVQAVLKFMGILQLYLSPASAEAPHTRLAIRGVKESIEISWKCPSSLYLTMSYDIEEAFKQLDIWLKKDREASLSCLAAALKLFFPSLSFIKAATPPYKELNGAASAKDAVYHALLSRSDNYSYEAFLCFLGLHAAGWREMEVEEVLALPFWLCYACEQDHLGTLAALYQNSRYAAIFGFTQDHLSSLPKQDGNGVRMVGFQALVLSEEKNIVPEAWLKWKAYSAKVSLEECVGFMKEIRRRLSPVSLSGALRALCELCNPKKSSLSPEQRASLLVEYYDLIKPSSPEILPSVQSLDRFIEALQPQDLWNYVKTSNDPEKTWNHLRTFYRIVAQRDQQSNNFIEIGEVFEKVLASDAKLSSKEGVLAVFSWIEKGLRESGQEGRIPSLLRYVPAGGNKIAQTSLEASIEQMIEKESSIESAQGSLEQLRKSGAYRSISPALLRKLLHYLLNKAGQSPAIKDAKVRTEIHTLKNAITFNKEDFSLLLSYFLTYYPSPFEVRFEGAFIDDLIHHLDLFKEEEGMDVAHQQTLIMLDQLKQAPKEDKDRWRRFERLFGQLKKGKAFRATVLSICKSLSTLPLKDFPFHLFNKEFVDFASHLSESQQLDLGQTVELLLQRALGENKEKETISSFSVSLDMPFPKALDWLLRREETWNTYGKILFSAALRHKKLDLSAPSFSTQLLWVAERILKNPDSSMLPDLRQALLSPTLPRSNLIANADAWKPLVAGLISQLPVEHSSIDLLQILSSMSKTSEEREFFDHCQKAYRTQQHELLQDLLGKYHLAGTMPPIHEEKSSAPEVKRAPAPVESPSMAKKIRTLLSAENLSAEALQTVVIRLEKANIDDKTLWAMVRSHVIRCFPMEIKCCWLAPSPSTLRALFFLVRNQNLKTHVRSPSHSTPSSIMDIFDTELQISLILLLAKQQDAAMNAFCEEWLQDFLKKFQDSELFKKFFQKPFVPQLHRTQQMLYACVDRGFQAGSYAPDWNQAAALIEALCRFTPPLGTLENQDELAADIFSKWKLIVKKKDEELTSYLRGAVRSIDPTGTTYIDVTHAKFPTNEFIKATGTLLTMLLYTVFSESRHREIRPGQRTPRQALMAVAKSIHLIDRNFFENESFIRSGEHIVAIWPRFITHALNGLRLDDNESKENAAIALRSLVTHFPVLSKSWNAECETAFDAFSSSLKSGILTLCAVDKFSLQYALRLIELLSGCSEMLVQTAEGTRWFSLLLNFVEGIYQVPHQHRKKILQALLKVFCSCLHPDQIKNKKTDRTTLITVSSRAFGYFLNSWTHEFFLEPEEWSELFEGISEETMRDMLAHIASNLRTNAHPADILSFARIISYTKPYNPQYLSDLSDGLLKERLPPLALQENDLSSLVGLRLTQGLYAFINKCRQQLFDHLKLEMLEQECKAHLSSLLQSFKPGDDIVLQFGESVLINIVKETLEFAAQLPFTLPSLSQDDRKELALSFMHSALEHMEDDIGYETHYRSLIKAFGQQPDSPADQMGILKIIWGAFKISGGAAEKLQRLKSMLEKLNPLLSQASLP